MDAACTTIPTAWIETYIEVFESGRVQKHAQAKFVNEAGECCLVAALAGARSGAEFVTTAVYAGFHGSELERLSRHFEAGRVTGQQFYEEALLELTVRRAARIGHAGHAVVQARPVAELAVAG